MRIRVRLFGAIILIAIGAAITGCAGKTRPIVTPAAPTVPQITDCFNPQFLGDMRVEWFENIGQFPLQAFIAKKGGAGQTVCEMYLMPRERRRGPASWAHVGHNGQTGWQVSNQFIASGTNDTRTVGGAQRKTGYLMYQPGYGWYMAFTLPRGY